MQSARSDLSRCNLFQAVRRQVRLRSPRHKPGIIRSEVSQANWIALSFDAPVRMAHLQDRGLQHCNKCIVSGDCPQARENGAGPSRCRQERTSARALEAYERERQIQKE